MPREEAFTDGGELSLEHLQQAVLERVRADDASVVSEENNTATVAAILLGEEDVFADLQSASIVTCRALQHDLGVFVLALAQHA